MADNKYGRIFTEDDVRKMLSTEMTEEDVRRTINEFKGKFPADEPVFVLRAKDRLALSAVKHYQTRCEMRGGIMGDHLVGVDHAVRDFDEFRIQNPTKMKDPD